MTSAWQMKTNAENAKKSTGPRTAEGKERARMNSVKHGMTARVGLLPEENFPEFKLRMFGIFEDLRPRTRLESALAERVAYSFVRSERASRALAIRSNRKASTGAQEEADRTEREVRELTQVLFRSLPGRAAAHPYAEQQGGPPAGARTEVICDGRDHPALVVGRLETSGPGCEWLRARWNELGELLEDGLCWRAPDRFRAFRLLGIHPSDALFTCELTTLLRTCETLDPGAGSLVAEIWNVLVSAEALPALVETYERECRHSRTWDEASARQYLLGVVKSAIARLDAKEEFHAFREEVESDITAQHGSFDESREAALLRRYEEACDRELHKSLAELRATQADGQKLYGYSWNSMKSPSPSWLPGMESLPKFEDQEELNEDADCNGDDQADEMAEPEMMDSFSGSSDVVRNESSRMDSESEGSESWAEDVLRNEPSAELKGCEAESGQEHSLRNEPSSGFEGQGARDGQVSDQRDEASRAEFEVVGASGAVGSDSPGERSLDAQANSQHTSGEPVSLGQPGLTAIETGKLAESGRVVAFVGIRRDRAHENPIQASRRERRRRKREERRARSRNH